MAAERDEHWRRGFATEMLVYGVLAAAFLWAYVARFDEPVSVVHRHLIILATLLVLPWGLRVLAWRFAGDGRLVRGWAAILMVVPLLVLCAWYALVLVGLDAWGRVPTWPLIQTYVLQAPALLEVLGITPWLVGMALLMLVLTLGYLVWRYLAPRDWARGVARFGSPVGSGVITLGVILLAVLLFLTQMQGGVRHPREPIAQCFMSVGRGLQSHVVQGSPVIDAREERARASYMPVVGHAGRNLVVIVGDALRADHMSVYGYGRETTPALAAKVRTLGGEVVPRMRSACAESSCGLMAMAASRPVMEIGTRPLTMQEVLKRQGYAVHFILGGDHTNFYGLKEMYGDLDSFHDGSGQRRRYMNDDQLVLDRVKSLPAAEPGRPVVFQFHLMSTHGLGWRDPVSSPFQPSENYYRWPGSSPKRPPNTDAAAAGVNYYDNGLVRFDTMANSILDELQRKGYLDDALVVVTGDHGEMLGEQGLFSHQYGLSEPVLGIPFVMLRYGYKGTALPAHPLSWQADVAPTILKELGLSAPEIWEGKALQEPSGPREIRVQQGRYFGIYHVGADGGVVKYVRDLDTGNESVTDPVTDPAGLSDLREQVSPSLLRQWRSQSMKGMLNVAAPVE